MNVRRSFVRLVCLAQLSSEQGNDGIVTFEI